MPVRRGPCQLMAHNWCHLTDGYQAGWLLSLPPKQDTPGLGSGELMLFTHTSGQYLAGSDSLQVEVGVACGGVDAVLCNVLVGVVRRGLRQALVDALPGHKGMVLGVTSTLTPPQHTEHTTIPGWTLTSLPTPPEEVSRPPTAAPSMLHRKRPGSPEPHRCPEARRAVERKVEGWG